MPAPAPRPIGAALPVTAGVPARTAIARFLAVKARGLASRARRLATLTPESAGLDADDMPYAPSPGHFRAANARLAQIGQAVERRLAELARLRAAQAGPRDVLMALAMVEREVDRARRAYGMFHEIFAQRGTPFAPSLAAHDAIARDCYAAVAEGAPRLLRAPLLAPISYLEHGYSPATMRRGVTLSRLLGESNPFPVIRIPWDRDRPWQAVFLHEVAHNLQADMGLWVENRNAVIQRLAGDGRPALVVSILGRWHKEIFADLCALLLGGPAVAWGMAVFLAHPEDKVMTYRPGGPHPTGYLRVLILAEMMRRMGFAAEGAQLARIWKGLYDPRRGHRMPALLLREAPRAIPAVVDEICFQPRRALAERALAGILRFGAEQQAAIRRGALGLARGRWPSELPPRFLVSACGYAIDAGADIPTLSRLMVGNLSRAGAAQAAPDTRQQVAA
ncbi:hypothetical protein [Crenalkalicoccus roseus]|uniref:hypothetical protein n=1 Tax=Crenalkalicoccus roseus TaxID=1485588 RepID=UPI00195C7647|nr:hypothetical protein [Crenalkalicoccus roseus]